MEEPTVTTEGVKRVEEQNDDERGRENREGERERVESMEREGERLVGTTEFKKQ